MKKFSGITLVELIIVVAIVGILAAISLPTYMNYVLRDNHLDAKNSLESLRFVQQKWRANNLSYAALTDVWTGSTTKAGHYSLRVLSYDAIGFLATATPTAAQAMDACGTFAINQDGPISVSYAPKECWAR